VGEGERDWGRDLNNDGGKERLERNSIEGEGGWGRNSEREMPGQKGSKIWRSRIGKAQETDGT